MTIAGDANTTDDGDATVTVSGTASNTEGATNPSDRSLTIADNDPTPTVSLVLTPDSISEDGGVSTATATLNRPSSHDTTVTVSASGPSSRYTQSGTALTIPAGKTSSTAGTGTVTITGKTNTIDDGNATVTVSGTASNGRAVNGPASADLTIIDDDVTVSFLESDYTATEGGAAATVTVNLSEEPGRSVTIPIVASGRGGATTDDFTLSSTSLAFARNETSRTFTVKATDDSVDDDGERVSLSFGALPSGVVAGSPATETVELVDNDVPEVSISADNSSVIEGGNARFTLRASPVPGANLRVAINATDRGNYIEGTPPTYVTIRAGASSASLSIPTDDDSADEAHGAVAVTLKTGTGYSLDTDNDSASVTVWDDDVPTVAVSFSATGYTAVEGGSAATVTVKLSAKPEREVAIPIVKSHGGGATTSDYTGVPENVTFASDDTSVSFTVTATNDSVDDDGESVALSFGALPFRVTAGSPATATVSLVDDDIPQIGISAGTSPVTEGSSASFTVNVSPVPGVNLRVPIDVSEEGDYVDGTAPTHLDIPAGSSSVSLNIATVNDSTDEADGSVAVTLRAGTGYSVDADNDSASVTVRDNDVPAVTVSFSSATYTATEGAAAATVTVNLSAKPERKVVVPIVKSHGGGATTSDYSGVPENVTFASDDASVSFAVAAVDDTIDDDGERLSLSFGALPAGVTAGSRKAATVSLGDNDAAPTVTLSLSASSIGENGGSSTVTASLSHPSSVSTTVEVSAAAVAPTAADDFTLSENTTLTIAAGATASTGTVTVTADDNQTDAPNKSVTVSGAASNSQGVAGDPADRTLTIADNDPSPTVTLSLSPGSIAENGGASTVTASLSHPSSEATTVTVSASGPEGSYTQNGTALTVAAEATTSTGKVTVTATDDDVDGADKAVIVSATAANAHGITGPLARTLKIVDDDDPQVTVSFSSATFTAAEGGTAATVTVNLSADPERSVAIPIVSTPTGGATAQGEPGADYSGVPASVTISSGSTSATFTVTATDDPVDDDGESVSLSFGTLPAGVAAGTPATAAVALADNDSAPAVTLSLSAASIAENGGTATIAARLDRPSTTATTIAISAAAVSPAAAADFSLSDNRTLTIAAGATDSTGTVTATAIDNNVDAPDKTVTISGTVSGAPGIADPADAALTIADDEAAPTVTLEASSSSTEEGGAPSTVTARLSHPSSEPTEVVLTLEPAVSPQPDLRSGTTLTIPAGATTGADSVSVGALDDDVDEPDRTTRVSATASNPQGVAGDPEPLTVTIRDNDPTPTVSLALTPAAIAEGGSSTVTAALSHPSSEPTTVTISASGPEGSFTLVGTTLSIAARETGSTGAVTVEAADDDIDGDDKSVTVSGVAGNAHGATGPAPRTLTIEDDDEAAIEVSFSASAYTAAEGGTAATVTVNLSADPGEEVTIPIDSAAENGATAQGEPGADYSGIPENVIISNGSMSATFTVTAEDDDIDDDDETVALSFGTLPDGFAAGSPATATVEIVDDDTRGVTLSKTALSVAEGNSGTYTVMLDSEPTADVTVTFASDNADVTVDTGNTDNNLVFTAEDWATPQTVMVSAAADDDTVDDTATIAHAVAGGDYADVDVESVTVSVTVTEVDSTPRLQSAVANRASLVLTYGEPLDSGSTPAASAFAVTVEDSDGTHTVSGVSISGSAVTLTLSPEVDIGETVTVSYTVPATNPIQDEAGNDADPLTDRAAVNETTVEVTVSFAAATYTAGEGGTAATVTVNLSADPERDVTIPIEPAPTNGATAQGQPGADYSGLPASVTFADGATEATFTVTATDDTVDDDGESIALSFGMLPAGVTATGQITAAVAIADNDAPSWSVTLNPSTLVEAGGTSTLTVSTGGTVTFPANKTLTLVPSGTATAETDYTISAGGQALSSPYSVTLPAGDTAVTATLTAISDSVSDMDETATIEARLDSTALGTATATIVEGICGRTPAVRDAIVAAIGSGTTCGDVTAAQLAAIATLTLADSSLSSLQAGDFDGLTGLTTLDLKANQLTSLPANVFDGLSALSILNLKNNRLTSLPPNIFGGLSALTRLTLENNRVATLRSDAFSGLSSLQELVLRKNRLTSLPAGIFSGLSALTDLNLRNNDLGSLAGDVFSGLASLDVLLLQSNDLSSLPDGLFAGLGGLTQLRLDGNNALSMSVSLVAVGDDQFKAVAPVGAPFALELPVSVTAGGAIAGSATRITIPVGAVESGPLTVDRTAGTHAAVTADLGALPALPDKHQGYSLARSSDLPLEVLAAVPLPTVSIAAVSAEVTEGAGAAFTLTRTGATDAPVDVSVLVTESGTVFETASDYASAVTVNIPTGSATATLTVATDDDALDEELTGEAGVAGRITAAVQTGTGYTPAGSGNATATVAVHDNDPLGIVVTPTDSALVGNLGQNPVGSLFVHSTMTLYQAFTTGSDAPGHDGFVLGSVSANVQNVPDTPSGVTVSIYSADTLGSPDSSLHTLTNPASFTTGANTFAAPTNATLDAGTTYFVAFAYTGTDALDFQLLSTASVTEDAGGATGWSIADSEHGVSSGVLMIGLDGRAVAAPTASLSVAGGRADEGTDTSIDFAVTLDRTSAQNVTVSYRTVDGTALAGQDYSAASGILTFSPGDTSKTVSVTVLDDLVDEDEERFTLILYNASGANVSNAQATGTIANSDPLPQAWLVRFGRTVATHVADGIGERLARAQADTPEATFAGLRMPFGREQPMTPPNALFGGDPGGGRLPRDRGWGAGLARYGASDSEQLPSVPGASSRGLTAQDLLVGSSFVAPLTEGDETGAGWTWWGRGMASRFDGAEDNLNLDADVNTYMLGADTQRGRWLAGVALAHSTGTGGYDAVLTGGRTERGALETAMTSVHPYARFAVNERLSAWGILGYGAGELALDRDGAGLWTTDTSMLMGAAGARGVLRPAAFAAGTELAIRTDVMWTSIASEESETAAGRLAGSDGTASRLRLLLEGSRTFAFEGARILTPTLEFGLRQDAGDAENGAGIELGGGLRFADPARGLSVELRARGLVAHRDADYSEWGASAAIQFDPGIAGKGLMLSLAPSWGAASSGAERLWSQPDAHGLAPYAEFLPEGRLDAELAYAMTGPRGQGMQTPYAALSQADAGDRTLRLGWRLAMSPLRSLDLEGIHRQPANGGPAENAVLLRMALRW